MPRLDGLEATRRLLKGPTRTRVVMLTTFDLDEYVFDALAARGQRLPAQGRPTRAADRRDPGGRRRDALLAPSITRRLIEEFVRRPPARAGPPRQLSGLTARELEVLRLLAGLSNAEIAAELVLGEATRRSRPMSATC
jgi:DNA-binding NarL/FixJ family response regulator